MKTYNVWTYIEEIDEDKDHYEDVGEPLSIGEFDTFGEADSYREGIRNEHTKM